MARKGGSVKQIKISTPNLERIKKQKPNTNVKGKTMKFGKR